MERKMKIAVVGARRGLDLAGAIRGNPEAELVAICDFDQAKLGKARLALEKAGSKAGLYDDLEALLSRDFDVAVVANYATEHAPLAVRLLDSGRHVYSEVAACQSLAEAVALVEAAERNPKQVYGLGENYCYFRSVLEMRRLYRSGALGQALHMEGEYVHDCESIWPSISYGDPAHWRNWVPSTFYCTHSLGPLMSVTGARPLKLSAYEGPNVVKRSFGARSSDGSIIVCQMSDGSTAKILPFCNYRRHPGVWYALYGSKGTVETDRWASDRVNLFVEGDPSRSDQLSYTPRMPCEKEMKGSFGHGGSDYVAFKAFLDAALGRESQLEHVDVYKAVDMSMPGLLGYRSILQGNAPQVIPDLRLKANRDKFRSDSWSLDPAKAAPGQPKLPSSSFGEVEIPDSVYAAQRKAWLDSVKCG